MGLGSGALQSALQGQRVDDRGQHAHLVALHSVESPADSGQTPENVTAADHDSDLHALGRDRGDLFGVAAEHFRGKSVLLGSHQRFAAEFQ